MSMSNITMDVHRNCILINFFRSYRMRKWNHWFLFYISWQSFPHIWKQKYKLNTWYILLWILVVPQYSSLQQQKCVRKEHANSEAEYLIYSQTYTSVACEMSSNSHKCCWN